MKNILRYPKFTFVTLVTEWISMKETALLDTSYCSAALRPIFLDLIKDSSAKFQENSNSATNYFLQWISKRGIKLSCLMLNEPLCLKYLLLCKVIDTLFISDLAANNEFEIDAKRFDCLTNLSLNHSAFITDAVVSEFRTQCPHLLSVTIDDCANVTSESLFQIIASCRSLTSLTWLVSSVASSTATSPHCIPTTVPVETATETAATATPIMINPSIARFIVTPSQEEVNYTCNEADIARALRYMPNLEVFQCKSSSECVIESIYAHCPLLIELRMPIHSDYLTYKNNTMQSIGSNIIAICARPELTSIHYYLDLESVSTDESIAFINDHGHKIKTLEIFKQTKTLGPGTNFAALEQIVHNSPNIEHLKLLFCDESVKELLGMLFMERPQLVTVELFYYYYQDHCDYFHSQLGKHCSRLRKLILHNINGLSNTGFLTMTEHCHELEYFEIKYSNSCNYYFNHPPTSILSLVTNNPRLRVLRLYNISVSPPNNAIEAIGLNCPDLTYLGLNGISSMTDGAILAVLKGCTKLRTLDLGYIEALTGAFTEALLIKTATNATTTGESTAPYKAEGVVAVPVLAPCLTRLAYFRNKYFTPEALQQLKDCRKKLEVIKKKDQGVVLRL